MSHLPVIIIAGGANSRFFPLNTSTHKSGLQLCGQTLLERTLRNLQEHGFQDVTIVTSPRDQESQLLAHDVTQAGLDLHIQYVIQSEAKGMGDAVLRAVPTLDLKNTQRYAVVSAYQTTAGAVLEQMLKLGQTSVLATTITDHPWEYGIAAFNEMGQVVGIVEKPAAGTEPSNQKIQSIYILTSQFSTLLHELPETEYNFEQALELLLKKESVSVLKLTEGLPSLKYPWQLFNFQEQLLSELRSFRHETAQVVPTAVIDETHGPVYLNAGAIVSHCARIVGPCYLGKNTFVGDFSLVRSSNLEEGVRVGVYTEVARSIFLPHATIHSGFVGDSIISNNVKIGAGFTTANKRFDRQPLRVEVKGKYVDTGRTGLGVIVGEHTHIGVNVSTMPGKCIGARSIIYPNSAITRNIEVGSVIKDEALSRK